MLGGLWPTIWLFTAAIVFSSLLTSTAGAAIEQEEAIFHARHLSYDAHFGVYHLKGRAMFILGPYILEADDIVWDRNTSLVQARGHVRLATPDSDVTATSLTVDLQRQSIEFTQGQVRYQEWMTWDVAHATITPELWQAEQVTLTSDHFAVPLKAAQARFWPRLAYENLHLHQLTLGPLVWPQWNLTVTDSAWPHFSFDNRPLNSGLLPSLGWGPQGPMVSLTQRWHESLEQRFLTGLSYQSEQGFVPSTIWEWRPLPSVLLSSQAGWQQTQGLTGHQELFWHSPQQGMLRLGARYHEPAMNLAVLGLPWLALSATQPVTTEAVFSSAWQNLPLGWGQWRMITGALLMGPPWQSGGGMSVNWLSPAWDLWRGQVQLHTLGNYFNWNGQSWWTGATRSIWKTPLGAHVTLGGYFEIYRSTAPENLFWKPNLQHPRVGSFALWDATPDLTLGVSTELSVLNGQWSALEGIVSWRWQPLVVTVWIQGIPLGLQSQVTTSVF